jgi:hypothetical protein
MSETSFRIEPFLNPHLPVGATRVDVVLTLTCAGSGPGAAGAAPLGVCFVIDVSGSMTVDGKKQEAVHAVRKGIEILPESAWFAVVAFNDHARVVVSPRQATPRDKALADAEVRALQANGGTAMSTGLDAAAAAFAAMPVEIRHAIFLTDGDNQEPAWHLDTALQRYEGRFQCDCRGVGTDWKPEQLRQIASTLLGSAMIIREPEQIAGDFRQSLDDAMGKGLADVRLRLRRPKTVKILQVKQMQPAIEVLTGRAVAVDDRTADYPTGSWGTESRDFHLAFEMPAGAVGDEIGVCVPSVVYVERGTEAVVKGAPVAVTWTEDEALTTAINAKVAENTGRGELAAVIQEGLEARAKGDEAVATQRLGRAAQIAAGLGDAEMTQRIAKVVDIVDAEAGTVRLRRADKADVMELDLGSVRTQRIAKPRTDA